MYRFIAVALALSSPCRAAEHWQPDNDTCNQQPTTYAIASCIDARAKVWDQRLNQAYQALLATMTGNRANALKTAQRAWLAYRNANCAFYDTEDGTIRLIDVATCNRDMLQARAIELQGAGPQG